MLAPLSAAAFSWRDFWGIEVKEVELLEDFEVQPRKTSSGTSVENDISVSASTGGNSANGSSSSSGGTVTTGNARASVSVQTSVDDDDFEDIKVEIETEGEPAVIERHVATSSGKVKVETSVRVEVGATSSESAAELQLRTTGEGKDVAEQTEEGDVFEDTDSIRDGEEIETATRANISELSERNQERLRGFFRKLFSRLFSFFDF